MSLEAPLSTERPAPDQPTPSLSQAYAAHHGFEGPAEHTPEPEKETRTLGDLEDLRTQEANKADARAERRRQLRTERNSLEDAHDGVSHESEIESQLEAEAAEAAELNAEVDTFRKAFEEDETEESEEESEAEPEEEEQIEGEEEPEAEAEQPKPEIAMPASLAELLQPGNEEAAKQLATHISETWDRSVKTTQPIMLDVLTHNLATVMQTPEEHVPAVRATCEVLNYAAQSFAEAAVPPMVEQHIVSFVRNNFQQVLEAFVPELGEMRQSFTENLAAKTWADTVASEEFASLKLPAFATPEFNELAEKVYQQNPWLAEFDPVDAEGKQLPIRQALAVKAQVAARLCAGARVNPKEILRQVVEAGKKGKQDAERSARRVSAGRMLGSGKSTGSIGVERSDQQSLIDAYAARHSKGGF